MKIKLQSTLIYAFISLNIFSFNVIADTASNAVATCNAALEKGDYSGASLVAESLLKENPQNRDAFLCKGRALGSLGKYDEALVALNKALQYSQAGLEQIYATIFIGNLHQKNHQIATAIASYEKSLNLSLAQKNDKFARINYHFIGHMHEQNKDFNAALTRYLNGAKLDMNDNERAESNEYIAACYRALGQHNLAIEHQLKATLMQHKAGTLDEYANASYILGLSYHAAGEFDAAERTLIKLLKFSKENGGAYYEAKADFGLAQVKAAKGEKEQANSLLAEALKIAKANGEADLVAEIETVSKKINP